ncbi:MAG: hypothetical protein AYK19_19160 [Theionarchaea archaeon DG-70-1]|nr:MAG: hypothetical protein AYK19_19160 [Theionarchaea archaeon DG-70-1]
MPRMDIGNVDMKNVQLNAIDLPKEYLRHSFFIYPDSNLMTPSKNSLNTAIITEISGIFPVYN